MYIYNKVKDDPQVFRKIQQVLNSKKLASIFPEKLIKKDYYIQRLDSFSHNKVLSINQSLEQMPKWSLDLSSTFLFTLALNLPEEATIVCDNNISLKEQQEELEQFINRRIAFADSKSEKGIQIADLIASAGYQMLKKREGGDLLKILYDSTEYQFIFIPNFMEHFPDRKFKSLFDKAFKIS